MQSRVRSRVSTCSARRSWLPRALGRQPRTIFSIRGHYTKHWRICQASLCESMRWPSACARASACACCPTRSDAGEQWKQTRILRYAASLRYAATRSINSGHRSGCSVWGVSMEGFALTTSPLYSSSPRAGGTGRGRSIRLIDGRQAAICTAARALPLEGGGLGGGGPRQKLQGPPAGPYAAYRTASSTD
jgi:hypothetical protein